MIVQQRRDLAFLVLAGLFLGTMGMLNILGLTRFLQLGSIGSWPIVVAVGALPPLKRFQKWNRRTSVNWAAR